MRQKLPKGEWRTLTPDFRVYERFERSDGTTMTSAEIDNVRHIQDTWFGGPIDPKPKAVKPPKEPRMRVLREVCAKGHALTGDNVITGQRQRRCRACTNERKRAYRERRRAAQAAA